MAGQTIEWVEVDCPSCGNVNRAARRHCRSCGGSGKALKSMAVWRDADCPPGTKFLLNPDFIIPDPRDRLDPEFRQRAFERG